MYSNDKEEIKRLYKGAIEEVIRNVRNDFVNMGVDEQLWEQKLMDYKVISPLEYYGSNGMMLNDPSQANYPHAPHYVTQGMVPAPNAAYPFNPEAYGFPHSGVRPQNPPGPTNPTSASAAGAATTTTYYHPSHGYFEANNAVNTPPSAGASANTAAAYPIQRSAHAPSGAKRPNPPTKPSARYDGAADDFEDDDEEEAKESDEGKDESVENLESISKSTGDGGKLNNRNDPEDIMKLLCEETKKQPEDESEVPAVAAKTTATDLDENCDDDLINSDLDDEDDEDGTGNIDSEGEDDSTAAMDENVVLCQYEKVNRTRNKWRCTFKSGIIHVNGADYPFSRANGEFEW